RAFCVRWPSILSSDTKPHLTDTPEGDINEVECSLLRIYHNDDRTRHRPRTGWLLIRYRELRQATGPYCGSSTRHQTNGRIRHLLHRRTNPDCCGLESPTHAEFGLGDRAHELLRARCSSI